MATVVARRTAVKVSNLAASIANVKSLAGKPLPPTIKSLRVRCLGLAQNAGATHWTRTALPPLIFANPSLSISIDPSPNPKTRRLPPVAKSEPVDAATDQAPAAPEIKHNLLPGVFIDFHDPTTPQAFFPLTSAKAEKLAKRFNDTVYNAKLLAALPKGEDIDSKPYVAPVEEVEEVAAVGEDGVKVEESISTEGVQKGGAVL